MKEKDRYFSDFLTAQPNEENVYEMLDINTNITPPDTQQSQPVEAAIKKEAKQSAWSKPLVVITVLLILLILVAILCLMLTQMHASNAHASTTATANTNNFPDFDEWANGVVSKVNQSLPDFNEWAHDIVIEINSNVTGSLHGFNEWPNGVVSKVNSNVTGSLPDFNEWANGVAQNTFQLLQSSPNFTELDTQILQTTRDSAQKLINIVNTLSNLQDTSTSTAGVVDDILLIAQELLVLHNDSTALPTSCTQLKSHYPSSPTGYYVLATANGSTTYTAYCNMGLLCDSGGGWIRLAYLDMTDSTENCLSGFRLYQSGGVRACGKQTRQNGCVSVQFPSHSISYSQVCGRVTGYLFGSIDALNSAQDFDGVSITRGSSCQKVLLGIVK